MVSVLVAELAEQILSGGRVHEVLVQLADGGRHAVLLEGVVVAHPRRCEDKQEGVLQLARLPSFSPLVFLPEELQRSGEDVADDSGPRVLVDDGGANESGDG